MLFQINRTHSVKYIWEHSSHLPAVIHLLPSWPELLGKENGCFFQVSLSQFSIFHLFFISYNANHSLSDIFFVSLLPFQLSSYSTFLSWLSRYFLVLKSRINFAWKFWSTILRRDWILMLIYSYYEVFSSSLPLMWQT